MKSNEIQQVIRLGKEQVCAVLTSTGWYLCYQIPDARYNSLDNIFHNPKRFGSLAEVERALEEELS